MQSLSRREVQILSGVLGLSSCLNNSLIQSANNLLQSINKLDYGKFTRTMILMVENDLISHPGQILTVIAIIYEMFKNDSLFSVYLTTLKSSIQEKSSSNQAIIFFLELIFDKPDQVHEFLLSDPASILKIQFKKNMLEPKNLKIDEDAKNYSLYGLSCIIPDIDAVNEMEINFKDNFQFLLNSSDNNIGPLPTNGTLKPKFLRLQPPLMPLVLPCLYKPAPQNYNLDDPDFDAFRLSVPHTIMEEMIWLNPMTMDHEFHFDMTMGSSHNDSELKHLLNLAYIATLNMSQQKTLSRAISEKQNAVREISLDPIEFHNLVNHNSIIAIEVIKCFIHSEKINDYLASLVSMEITVQSMEVVNRLSTAIELPIDFTRVFVNKCITACNSIDDKYQKTRLVRMVCLLFQSLIRNNHSLKENDDLLAEMQNFSTEHTETGPGSGLYRLLRGLENNKRSFN